AADPPRIILQRGGLLLLLRPLVCRPVHGPAARCRPIRLPGPTGPHYSAAPGKGRQLVGLPALRLPPAIRHRDGGHDARPLPKINGACCRRATYNRPLTNATRRPYSLAH